MFWNLGQLGNVSGGMDMAEMSWEEKEGLEVAGKCWTSGKDELGQMEGMSLDLQCMEMAGMS